MKMQKPTNLYDEICSMDIIAPIKNDLMSGKLKMRVDFKIYPSLVMFPGRPWLNAAHDYQRDCSLWNDYYFRRYHIVPNGCRNCWKVAMKPKTLRELFKVYNLQQSMPDQPSKCGAEQRGWTGNLGGYAAFWYAPLDGGLKQARALFDLIDAKLTVLLGKGHGLTLKRGCTEMENFTIKTGLGDADNWDANAPKFDMIEKLLNQVFTPHTSKEIASATAPWFMVDHIKRVWIEHAFEHGDMTYLDYVGGKPLVPTLAKFNGSAHSHIDFKTTFKEYEDGLDYNGHTHAISDGEGTDDADGELPESKIAVVS